LRKSLAGIRILDLTSYLSGPFATMTLAGLGADVIKVERRDGGDPARTFPPFCGSGGTALIEPASEQDESVAILKRNRGKRSLTLNLEDQVDRRAGSLHDNCIGIDELPAGAFREQFPDCRLADTHRAGQKYVISRLHQDYRITWSLV